MIIKDPVSGAVKFPVERSLVIVGNRGSFQQTITGRYQVEL